MQVTRSQEPANPTGDMLMQKEAPSFLLLDPQNVSNALSFSISDVTAVRVRGPPLRCLKAGDFTGWSKSDSRSKGKDPWMTLESVRLTLQTEEALEDTGCSRMSSSQEEEDKTWFLSILGDNPAVRHEGRG